MKLQDLLKYQEKDFEIFKLQRTVDTGEAKKLLAKAVAKAKQSQERSLQLEKQAADLVAEFENLKKLYDQNLSSLTVLANTSYADLPEQDIESYEKALGNLSNNVSIIESKVSSLAKTINVVLSNFEKEKRAYGQSRAEYEKNRKLFDQEQDKVKPKLNQLKDELKQIAKNIDQEVMEKYQAKRQDNRFPIIVQLSGNSCGGCQMELSYAFLNKLKQSRLMECEHCRRYLYFEG